MPTTDTPLILVADDEPSTLALVSNHLRGRGYRVIEAADGDEAWDLATRELPDLVVLDVMMPGMSGWEVCRKIRDAVSLAHTGVIMLTGIGDTLNELTSPLYGADAYLDKPFQFTKLQELVEDTLKSRKGGNLGRPERTAGPATRLWKTSISDAPPADGAGKRKVKTRDSSAPKPPVKAKTKPVAKATKAESAAPAKSTKAAPAPTAAPAKPAAKKVAKKALAKAAKKVAKKAPVAAVKKPAKKAPAKPAAKKVAKKAPAKAAKKVAKKAPAKPVAKKAPAKAAKKVAKKAPAKPAKKTVKKGR